MSYNNTLVTSHILSQIMQGASNKTPVSRIASRLDYKLATIAGLYTSEIGCCFGEVVSQCSAGLNIETTIYCAKVMIKFFATRAARLELEAKIVKHSI